MSDAYRRVLDFIRNYYGKANGPIGLHEPLFIGNERQYVLDTLDSSFVSSVGPYVDRFESMIKDYTGASYAVATVNGTAALHIALIAAGVKANDLVITQPLTFVATCNAVTYLGASPVFVDADRNSLGISPISLSNFLSQETIQKDGVCLHRKTRRRISCCLPMHTFGHPSDIEQILRICERFDIVVVEDAAESIGSHYHGRHTGTFGLLGTFSFNGNKTITCGGGGVIVTENPDLARLAKHLTTQAKVPHAWDFFHDRTAFNYRMPNLNAALGCAQLEMIDKFIEAKRDLANQYWHLLKGSDIEFVVEPQDTRSNYWLNTILLRSKAERDAFLAASNGEQVNARPAWKLMTELPMFCESIRGDLSVAMDLQDRLVSLPSSVRI